jgi:hypothetical protein
MKVGYFFSFIQQLHKTLYKLLQKLLQNHGELEILKRKVLPLGVEGGHDE